ncbi:lysophosphatidylcholine acyltransferase 3 protein nessy [Leptinotarsa decemlineata]|uniref:lysophosphatidylcholine acyltransferase 3 protein nessy n=1 Tax=Leptinotarsa decemlineata TaxID=7539 RepID=UPI003D30B250
MAKENSSCFILEKISEQVGTSEPALKLLLTVLAGYPLALIHRKYFYGKDVSLQHLFFIASGFSMGYWNYGRDMFHCVFTTFFTYCTLFILKGTDISVAITLIFNLGYLLIGYYYASTDSYDINWTMPQCILTLRLIGVAFDLYDGHQPVETLSKDSKKVALQKRPSLLEMFGHAFFPASFLVGPQFPMKRYQEFVSGQYSEKETPNQPPDSIDAAIRRFALGVLYLVIFQVLGIFVSDDLFISDEFGNLSFARRILLLGIWGRYTLYKYISCWLLTEGACILFGLTHNGEDENGEVQWNGLENIKISIFENTTEFGHFIQSFNVNTNQWSAQYIYKRLKFLGNRLVSQSVTLLFLAVWHGLHSGYYVCFLFEFIVMYMERDLKSIVKSNETLTRFFDIPQLQLPLQIILRIYTFVFMGWCLLPFALLHFHSYMKAFANVDYIGAVLFLLWPIVYAPILRLIFKKTKIRSE